MLEALPRVPAMTEDHIATVRRWEDVAEQREQVVVDTHHLLHGGQYTRTMRVPAGVMVTGALIKVPTTLILFGDVVVYLGDHSQRFTGYAVLPAAANRKQAFMTISETFVSMSFPTSARTVAEAEAQFTDEAERLLSRGPMAHNTIVTTGA